MPALRFCHATTEGPFCDGSGVLPAGRGDEQKHCETCICGRRAPVQADSGRTCRRIIHNGQTARDAPAARSRGLNTSRRMGITSRGSAAPERRSAHRRAWRIQLPRTRRLARPRADDLGSLRDDGACPHHHPPPPLARARQERWAPRAHGLMRDPRLLALSDGAVRVYAALVDGPEQSYLRGLLTLAARCRLQRRWQRWCCRPQSRSTSTLTTCAPST